MKGRKEEVKLIGYERYHRASNNTHWNCYRIQQFLIRIILLELFFFFIFAAIIVAFIVQSIISAAELYLYARSVTTQFQTYDIPSLPMAFIVSLVAIFCYNLSPKQISAE